MSVKPGIFIIEVFGKMRSNLINLKNSNYFWLWLDEHDVSFRVHLMLFLHVQFYIAHQYFWTLTTSLLMCCTTCGIASFSRCNIRDKSLERLPSRGRNWYLQINFTQWKLWFWYLTMHDVGLCSKCLKLSDFWHCI